MSVSLTDAYPLKHTQERNKGQSLEKEIEKKFISRL